MAELAAPELAQIDTNTFHLKACINHTNGTPLALST
jgi:hypothetical protein